VSVLNVDVTKVWLCFFICEEIAGFVIYDVQFATVCHILRSPVRWFDFSTCGLQSDIELYCSLQARLGDWPVSQMTWTVVKALPYDFVVSLVLICSNDTSELEVAWGTCRQTMRQTFYCDLWLVFVCCCVRCDTLFCSSSKHRIYYLENLLIIFLVDNCSLTENTMFLWFTDVYILRLVVFIFHATVLLFFKVNWWYGIVVGFNVPLDTRDDKGKLNKTEQPVTVR